MVMGGEKGQRYYSYNADHSHLIRKMIRIIIPRRFSLSINGRLIPTLVTYIKGSDLNLNMKMLYACLTVTSITLV